MKIVRLLTMTIIMFASVGIFNNIMLYSILIETCKDSGCDWEHHCYEDDCTKGCGNNNHNCTRKLPKGSHKKICLDKTCVECKKNTDCAFDKSKKYCVKNKCEECAENNECPLGQICKENKCEAGCDNSERCPLGQICFNGSCKEGCWPFEQQNPRCPIGMPNCYAGHCRTACKKDSDCKLIENCRDFSCVPYNELAN